MRFRPPFSESGIEYKKYSPAFNSSELTLTSSEKDIVVAWLAPVLQTSLNGTTSPKIFLSLLEGLE